MADPFHEKLSAQDAAFLGFESPTTPMHVSGQSIYEAGPLAGPEGAIDFARIRAHIASRLHLIPRYRQRLAYTPLDGHPSRRGSPRCRSARPMPAAATSESVR